MRIIKWILTSLVFSMTFVIVLAAEYGTLALLTIPGTLPGGNNIVERVHLFPDPNESNITYYDAVDFWSADFKESFEMAIDTPEYEVRSWFEWEWWQTGMRWADVALSTGKAVVVPAVAPIYEIKEMYIYYGRELNDPIFAEQFNEQFGANISYAGTVQDYLNGNMTNISQSQYKFIFNTERKLEKYNSVTDGVRVYQKFVEKFINYEGNINGVRLTSENPTSSELLNGYQFKSVDAVSAFLFYQLFLALVLAAYFTYQNPIIIKKNTLGENEVEGHLLPRMPKLGLGKRNKDKNKSKEGK
jgi:hypothetical protein